MIARYIRRASAARRGGSASGYSLPEIMLVVAMIGLAAMIGTAGWEVRRSRLAATVAARTLKTAVHQARMEAVYRGVDCFLVVDEEKRLVEIYADTGTTVGVFDTADSRVFFSNWEDGVEVAMPLGSSTLPHPTDGSTISTSWDLPAPDSSAAWGTDRVGFTLNSRGFAESADATPSTISSGTVVFSSGQGRVAAVVIRGRMGTVDGYELFDGSWRKL